MTIEPSGRHRLPPLARILGFAGLLPQAAAVVVLLAGDADQKTAALGLAYAYAAMIFSFLGGVYAMTLPIARDLAQEGVRCNTILPGIMWTPMMAGMDQKIQDALAAAIPFPSRLGTPADYASLVLELARNIYINGECIRLDGAIRLAPR